MSCLWVQRHKEAPMLIANIHQAGSATPELQQQVWMALQGVRAKYPEAQGILGGDFNANASGDREGYSPNNAGHMSMVDNQFQACVATIKGTLVSPQTPSWIDTQTGKGARLDHLVGLGVEFTCTSGKVAWVGSPFQDHARVSFAVKIGTPRVKDTNRGKREQHQAMTLKQWQGIGHLIDEPLKNRAMQSLERLKDGAGDADLERRSMIEARIAEAKKVMPSTMSEASARMPFRSKQQQALMRTRSRLEAALRETTGGKGLTILQLTCMHDLGITALSNGSLQDKELLTETPQWKALLKAEIQSNKNQLDALVKKQTWQCERQAKRKEAKEYLRDKKGPSKFCGNTHSMQTPKELVLDMPIGVMWINRKPTAESQGIVKRIYEEVPSVQIYKAKGEVAILVLTIPDEQASEGAALVRNAQQTWKWKLALRKPQHLAEVLRGLCLKKKQRNPDKGVLRQLLLEVVNILWEEQEGHRHAMTIGNTGSHHGGERSWWARGPKSLERLQEWEQWLQECHSSGIDEGYDCVSLVDGKICVEIKGKQQRLEMDMDTGKCIDTSITESSGRKLTTETEASRQGDAKREMRNHQPYPFSNSKVWHGPSGTLEVVYVQVKELLHWEELAHITRRLDAGSVSRKIIMNQGAWSEEEQTMAWERYMQTEGLSQHVSCQHCQCQEKPIAVVVPGKDQQRRQLTCFCMGCWSFTSIHHSRRAPSNVSFFKQYNHETGKFHRALPYTDEEHPRRIRGPVTDHEMDHFRKTKLKLRKAGGPNKETNELYRSLTAEELAVVRTWADRALSDVQSAASALTDEDLRCAIRLLHKGGDTSDKPSDWRPIGLLNVGTQLVHHVINYRLTTITEVENIIVPGQDGGRAGRGVDLNQLKLEWITSEAKRLKQRIVRIDIDFKNAFNSMSQSALWEVMRAYNIPDVDLLEAIYGRTTACMDPEDPKCAIITFLTGVIQGGASSPRIFTIFINALLEHLTHTGKALGISHGIEETDQFNHVAFMDDITVVAQDDPGSQVLMDAVQEFEFWSNTKLNMTKTVAMNINDEGEEKDPPQITYKQKPIKVLKAKESCRHLGFWATPDGDMTSTKKRVFKKTREVLELLMHHPLETKTAKELFQSMAVSVFRFSAAQVRWSQAELDQLQSLWTRAYKRAESLQNGTASDIFVFPKRWGGEELSTPINIIAQELCNNIRRCLVHDDVTKSITVQELQRAKEEFMCHTTRELYDEMELWGWDEVQHNRWARALKASHRVGVRPIWYLEEEEQENKRLSWATATRSIRRLRARITKVGGRRDQPMELEWQLEDAAQWELLFLGEEVFWKTAEAIRAAGYDSIYSLTQDANEKSSPTPLLTRENQGSRGTRHLRLLIPKGIAGVSEKERTILQAWLELVDWTGLGVLPKSQVSRRIKLNMNPMSQVFQWLRKEESQKGIKDSEMAHLFTDNRKELKQLAEAIRRQELNAASRVEVMGGGEALSTALVAWLKEDDEDIEIAMRVVEAVWPRVCIGRAQAHLDWTKPCETKVDLIQVIESWVRMNNARCARHLSKLEYRCPKCQHGMCTVCNEIEGRIQCLWCMEPFPQVPHAHQQQAHSRACTKQCLNIHALGEQWIEEVTDVEEVQTLQEECLEEKLKFKAHIRGWKTEVRKERCQQLLDKNGYNLRRALLRPLWKDVLLIPRDWYPEHQPRYETPGWWYVPAEEILGRECKSCKVFHELTE